MGLLNELQLETTIPLEIGPWSVLKNMMRLGKLVVIFIYSCCPGDLTESPLFRERGNRALVIVLQSRPSLRLRNAFKYSGFEASKLVSTKTLLLKHYHRLFFGAEGQKKEKIAEKIGFSHPRRMLRRAVL